MQKLTKLPATLEFQHLTDQNLEGVIDCITKAYLTIEPVMKNIKIDPI
jgi:hypothetical protein